MISPSEFKSFNWQDGCFNADGGNADDADDEDLDIIDCVDIEDKSPAGSNPEYYTCGEIETIPIEDITCSASSAKSQDRNCNAAFDNIWKKSVNNGFNSNGQGVGLWINAEFSQTMATETYSSTAHLTSSHCLLSWSQASRQLQPFHSSLHQ